MAVRGRKAKKESIKYEGRKDKSKNERKRQYKRETETRRGKKGTKLKIKRV